MKKWLHRIVVLCAWALVAGCREKPTGGNPAASASPRGEAGTVVDEKVSVIEVLARPAEFETRVVSVAGYFGAESWLFVSKEHARAGVLEYAVRLHFGKSTRASFRREFAQAWNMWPMSGRSWRIRPPSARDGALQ